MSKLNTDLIRQINDAWLDVGIDNKYIINPLEILRTDDPDEFHSRFTWLLMQPEYFSFVCKHILNIELLPMQALMLKEIWNRKFPMLVGSRGLGKATRCVEPILTNDGWVKMGDITYDHKVYSRNGSLCNIVGIYPQGKRQVCRLEFADGRQIDCCEDHLWVMKKGTKEVTISTKDIINEGVRFDCPSGKWAYKYKLPLCEPIKYDNKDLLIDPYILGCMLGDGCMTTATPKIASNDEFIIDQFRDRLDGFKIELDPTSNNYTIVDIDKQLNNRFLDKIRQLNVNVGCKDKFIPEEYKTSSIEDRMEIIRGLLDTDGTINKRGSIEFTNTCERLVDDLIDILRSLGISCIKSQEHTLFRVFINTSRPVFKLPRKLERLKKESTGREQYVSLISAEYTNEYDEMQCISVDSPDRTYITKDYIVTHNTFLLSLYCMLRAIFLPGRKIVVVGAAFRQSKFLHEYMETIWKNSPILRDICDSNSGPRRDVDMCRMNINGSVISALPIGDGCCRGDTLTTRENGFANLTDESSAVWGNGKNRSIEYNIDNGVKPTKIVTTKKGYSYEGTHNHAMKVLRDGVVDWVRSDEMVVGDRILIDRSQRWHDGNFNCSADQAYALGALIGDGCWTDKYSLSFATMDSDIIDRLNKSFGGKFTQRADKVHWTYADQYHKSDWLKFWGLNDKCYAKDKSLPLNILQSSKENMTSCLQALFDTDGHVFVDTSRGGTTISVNFTNTSKLLVEQMQYILLHYGIVSTLTFRDRNEKWNRIYELGIYGKNVKLFAEQINFHLSRKRDKLNNAIANKKKWNSFDDDIPLSPEVVEQSIDRSKRVPHVFCKTKIAAKKSFQQTFLKRLLPYCNNPEWASLLDENVLYDTVASIEDSECRTYDIHVPEGNEYCANGFFSHNSKIRGQRANDIVADEFACLRSSSIIQTDKGLVEIKDYLSGDAYDLLNINNVFETPDKIFKTPKVDVYEVETANGYSFACSAIHKVMTTKGWKIAKDLTKEDNLLLDVNDYFPSEFIKADDVVLDDNIAWLMGILVSEGSVANRNYISVKNTDERLVNKIKSRFSNFKWGEYYKKSYKDKRGWDCKESWEIKYSNTEFRDVLYKFGIKYVTALDKTIPDKILQSPKSAVIQFLSGLYEGDGTAFNYVDRDKTRVGVAYYSASRRLIEVLQILLLKFGIISSITIRNKNKISDNVNYMLSCRGANAYKLYKLLDVIKWNDKFDNANFLIKKPQIRKNGERYTVATTVGNKNKHIGTYNSEDECIQAFEEFQKQSRPVIRVRSVTKLDKQEHLYDFHMPETHSFMANGFVQHNSMSRDIFENVIAGFAAVSASPAENVKRIASEAKAIELGIDIEDLRSGTDDFTDKSNQIILSGTAYYDFNHFADYWKKWRAIINTKGDPHKIKTDVFNGEAPPESFSWDDYSIIRIPVDLVPKGFMDEGQIARSKATVHNGIYMMEFSACFAKDSQGFFKRSLIESCVGNSSTPVKLNSGDVYFDPSLKGDSSKRYVMGVDPASEVDNFSIIILELHEDHRRVVHCWTTTRKDHVSRVQRGLTSEDNFYSYCARKIRELMELFPICHIALDAQGGGIAVAEALHDGNQLHKGEAAIWPIIDEDKPQPSDDEHGLHILEMCQFARYEWYSEANHGLRKDLEDKLLLFPQFDPVTIGLSIEQDKANNRLYDTLEDCVMEIEELKNELSLIEITQTSNGRDRWNTPEVKTGVGRKQSMRKDRYSSLLMANMASRQIATEVKQVPYTSYGGFASMDTSKATGPAFTAPNWFNDGVKGIY